MDKIRQSREGHRMSVYFKEKYFHNVQKIVALTEYFRQKGNKKKQSGSYWINLIVDENIDELFMRIQQQEGITLSFEGKSLIITEKKTTLEKFIDKTINSEGK